MGDSAVIRKGDAEWERLYTAWRADGKEAGYLVMGSEQYKVYANDGDDVLFVRTGSNIDANYASITGGIPK